MASMGESRHVKYSALAKALPKPRSLTGVILHGHFVLTRNFARIIVLVVDKNQAFERRGSG